MLGCFPLYPPVELFHAMGLAPVVLWGLRDVFPATPLADLRLQGFTCSVARRLTEAVLSEPAAFDGLFAVNSCDTLRNLPEILRGQATLPILRMHAPAVSIAQTPAAAGYLEAQIEALIDATARAFGVSFSISRFEESVALCRQLDALRSFLKSEQRPAQARGVGVVLSGILPPPAAVTGLIEAAGLTVVANDIALMHRSWAYSPERASDPAAYYVDMHWNRFPCPTALHAGDRRVQAIEALVDRSGARGLIFVNEKFCEPESLELPYLDERLRRQGVRTLALEVAHDTDALEQTRTRVEAFAEMLR